VFLSEDLTIPEEVIRDFASSERSPPYWQVVTFDG
jgi:hypothetical protein